MMIGTFQNPWIDFRLWLERRSGEIDARASEIRAGGPVGEIAAEIAYLGLDDVLDRFERRLRREMGYR
jgi:hypothetical protein